MHSHIQEEQTAPDVITIQKRVTTTIIKVVAIGTLLYLLINSVSKYQERTYTNECKNNLNITPKNKDEIEVKIEYRY